MDKQQEQATAEDLLRMDLYEPYAKAVRRISVSKDLKQIEVVLDRDAPVGALNELDSRIKEYCFVGPALMWEGSDRTIHFKFERIDEMLVRVAPSALEAVEERRAMEAAEMKAIAEGS